MPGGAQRVPLLLLLVLVRIDTPVCLQVVQTDMFHQFLKDRFAQRADYWSDLEEKIRPLPRSSLDTDR